MGPLRVDSTIVPSSFVDTRVAHHLYRPRAAADIGGLSGEVMGEHEMKHHAWGEAGSIGSYRRAACALVSLVGTLLFAIPALASSVGNPRPGYAHDTIIVHVMKAASGPKLCDGGHSLFLRHDNGVIPPTRISITMVDWVQVDNDGDGNFDEDPLDGVDNDGDGVDGEDGLEPGAETKAIDCDAWGDGAVSLQIRDTDPRQGFVSTQEWFLRLIGRPEQNFAFTSYANQTVSCSVDPGTDGILGTDDDVATCESGQETDWVELTSVNLAEGGCVKQVKLGGGGVKAGGKTPFCDITEGFTVDVDTNNDGTVDLTDQFVFSVSCVDDPATLDVDETLYCPLSSVIWEVDTEETTSQAKAQIFVGHTGTASVKTGKIR
jgi:hypothetical protein